MAVDSADANAARWATVAAQEGFTTEIAMWEAIYVSAGGSLTTLSHRFFCTRLAVRARLTLCGIPIRRQGEPEQPLSDEELDAILSEGIASAARRLSLRYTTLHHRVQVAITKRRKVAQSAGKR